MPSFSSAQGPSTITAGNLSDRGSLGLLSTTVFPSPEIKHVFPVRIRSWEKQDVALIGDHFIHIKEVQSNGCLVHVATKADFPSPIQASQVLGSETAVEPVRENAKGPQRHAHVLLLTLASADLVFVTMSRSRTDQHVFDTCSVSLVSQPTPMQQPGRFLAVDPYSRAFAVAAPHDHVEIFEMEPRDRWSNSLNRCIRKRVLHNAEMRIAKADFLFPPHDQLSRIYLLLLGYQTPSSGQRTSLTLKLYYWDRGTGIRLVAIPQMLPKELLTGHGIPQMLVPLSRWPGGFLLACSRSIESYLDLYTGHARRAFHTTLEELNSRSPLYEDYIEEPLWKAWARPARRHPQPETSGNGEDVKETLYLAREDGVLLYLDLDSVTGIGYPVGHLGGNVESAFNHDGKSLGEPDGLIFGGGVSDGGVFQAGREINAEDRLVAMELTQTDALPNWAPFLDIAVDRSRTESANGKAEPSHENHLQLQLYGTSGRSPHGAVSQLRYGCEAVVQAFLDYTEGTQTVATNSWSFRTSQNLVASFLSSPSGTELVHDVMGTKCPPSTIRLSDDETFAAARFFVQSYSQGDFYVRVSTNLISMFHVTPPDAEVNVEVRDLQSKIETENILAAAIEPQHPLVLTATASCLTIYEIKQSGSAMPDISQIGAAQSLTAEATCATLFTLDPTIKIEKENMNGELSHSLDFYGAVGFSNGRVVIFSVHPSEGFVYQLEVSQDHLSTGDEPAIASSLAVVRGVDSTMHVLCGLRHGEVCDFSLSRGWDGLQLGTISRLRVGHSTVQVHEDVEDTAAAILTCYGRMMRYKYDASLESKPKINYIFVTKQEDRSYIPLNITAVSQVPAAPAHDDPTHIQPAQLLCTAGDELLTTKLDNVPKAVPLRLPIPGTPTRIFYSAFFKVFLVASLVYHLTDTKRWAVPAVFSVDPRDERPQAHAVEQLEPGQTITSVCEWTFTKIAANRNNGARVYRHVVLTTLDLIRDNENHDLGSLMIYRATEEDHGVSLELMSVKHERHPIWSVCQFDNETLIYTCGNEVKQWRYHADEKRDTRTKLTELPAANEGHLITASAPYVYISSASRSFQTYHLDATTNKLTHVFSDSVARSGLGHLTLPLHPTSNNTSHLSNSTLALFTDKEGNITGQIQHPSSSNNLELKTLSPTFTTSLPVSPTRLIQAPTQPPWLSNPTLPSRFPSLHLPNLTPHSSILGVATNGSLFAFTTLAPQTWRLLRFVQNLCARDARLRSMQPSNTKNQYKPSHIEPAKHRAADFSVDGDILKRLVERRDAKDVLDELVDAPVSGGGGASHNDGDGDDRKRNENDMVIDIPRASDGSDTDYSSAAMRRGRFEELVCKVVELGRSREGGGDAMERNARPERERESRYDKAEMVIELIRVLVENPL